MWFRNKNRRTRRGLKNPDYSPNRAEVAHYVRRFRKRRLIQRGLLLLFLGLPAALAASMILKREEMFRDGNWMQPSIITLVIVGLFVVAEIAIIVLTLINWRCPHCESRVQFRPHPKTCRHCGAKLRFTSTSSSDLPPATDETPPSDPPASADAPAATPPGS